MATKHEKNALNKIAELGCILCSEVLGIESRSPAELHHVRRFGAVRATSPILPLCPEHHRNGNDSLHRLGVKGFEKKWGISCEELLERVSQKLGKDDK
jgi:hypothetical protein